MKAKRILAGFMAAGMLAGYTLLPDAGKAFNVVASAAGDVAINATNFPDAKFRTYVSNNFDKDKNGSLSESEIAKATDIYVSGTSPSYDGGIASLKGIEYFTALQSLFCGCNPGLTSIDVSRNTALEELDCYAAGLTSLDVSKNVALIYLDFSYTKIASIDLNKNKALKYLTFREAENLTSIDISKNTALKMLDCGSTNITSLDVSKNTALTNLNCDNTGITSLDVSKNTALKDLHCDKTNITSLDVSKNTTLKTLCCSSTSITSLDVSKNTALILLTCDNTNITSLDASKNTALETLECSDTKITSLDVSKNTALTFLECGDTKITSLDVSKNTALRALWCYETKITSLDVRKNAALEDLRCYNTKVAYLNLTKNTSLTTTAIYGNKHPIPKNATSFDLNKIKGFDITKVSNVKNADFDSATGMLTNITADVTYTYNCGQGKSETFTLTRTLNGEYLDPDPNLDPDPIPDPNPDSIIIWANGKDIKDDKKTLDIDETAFYKTASYQNTGMFSGGKWCVTVTPQEIDTVEKFTSLFDDKGKLSKTEAGKVKKIAKAKIKDGIVTVTAGKNDGIVQVWVYELKNKKVVVDEALGIAPMKKTVYVRMAAGSLAFAEEESFNDGILVKGKKAVSKLTLMYKNGAAYQDVATVAFGDKKAAYHSSAEFVTDIKEKNGAVVSVCLGINEITVSPLKAGKATITLKNVQSGKTAKLNVTVVNAYKITVPEGAAVKYKSGKDYVTVKDGDYVPTKAKLEITAPGKTIKVNGTAVKGGKFTVGEAAVVITLE